MSEQNDIFISGYDTFTDGILITDNTFSLLSCNQAWKQLFNLPGDWTAHHFDEFVQILSERRVETEPLYSILAGIRSNPLWAGSLDLMAPNGQKIHLQSRPIPDTNKACIGRIWICTDVSEIPVTGERLEHSEKLFKMIFDLIPEGIAITDLTNGTFFEVNSHFNQWWGYAREEVIGKSAIDLDFWVDINQRIDIVNLIKRDGSCKLVPVKMRGKDKKVRNILFSGRIITIDGTPYLLSIPFDVTELMQYEEKVRSLASFIELNPNPIFEINESGTITMNNEATVQVIHDLTGTNDIYRFIPDDLNEILYAIQNGIETTFNREIIVEERTFIEYIYVTNRYHTARIYLTDITKRKRAELELMQKNDDIAAAYEEITSTEEELRQNYDRLVEQEHILYESEKKLKMIVDHIPGLVLTTDADMNVKSIFGAALAKIGLTPNTGVGHKIKDLFESIDASLLDAHNQALQGVVSTIEGYYRERTFLLYASPICDASDTITGTIGIAIDITEQKTLEKERKNLLIQLEKNLVELAFLNDKIRNPLAIISSLVDLHAPEIEEPVNRCVQDIDDIIDNLDKRWIESEKTINFLQKHYGINVEFQK
ncbi:MAG: PAS domain-containing protein [Methanospirillum sp.]|uniref:PAS domain S-box protein n=1 Tax=Methanospirillum sp. TaxID=45200 RepID=UPI00236B6BE2|nr:PAS domain S-box protein [Methanospirillum sp.]MDD1730066.1 PAS domain-containing protein [Methanospirillum sp.]